MLRIILLSLIIIILAGLFNVECGGCDCSCGQGEKIRATFRDTFRNKQSISEDTFQKPAPAPLPEKLPVK